MHDQTMASGIYMPEIDHAPTHTTTTGASNRFDFRGNARDYFRIWIVNVALSIVTLGIYSAWATVRTRRYMYANTVLADSPFDYQANPVSILRGRLLSGAFLAAYVLAGYFSKPLQLVAGLALGGFMPWMIVKGLTFRARYSSWRGLRFYFSPDYGGAYQWYLVAYIVMGIPFALLAFISAAGHPVIGLLGAMGAVFGIYPWIKGHQQMWMAENHHFGGKSFRFAARLSDYYALYGKAFAVALVWFIPGCILVGAVMGMALRGHQGLNPKAPSLWLIAAVYGAIAPMYLAAWTYTHVRMTNMLYERAQLGQYRFHSSLRYSPMLGLYVVNALAIVGSIGLAIPWARIRLARYRAAHLEILGEGGLDDFVRDAFAHGEIGATGTEMDALLGIDIGI